MALYRRKRSALKKMFLMPGALFEALRLEAEDVRVPRARIMYSALADRLRQSQVESVRKLIQEYDNEEGTIAAEKQEREERQTAPRF